MLGNTTLFIGTNYTLAAEEIIKIKKGCGISQTSSPDLYEIKGEDRSIGIEDVRKALVFLAKKPLISKRRLLVINNSQKLTIDAQNALLKTLEEPNTSSQIVLIADNEETLLPTVLSRCQKILIKQEFSPDNKLLVLAQKFASSGVGERLSMVDENKDIFTNREEAGKFLDTLCFCLRKGLGKEQAHFITLAMKVQRDIQNTNVNVRLAMEYLALN